jgi:hypothetical protein
MTYYLTLKIKNMNSNYLSKICIILFLSTLFSLIFTLLYIHHQTNLNATLFKIELVDRDILVYDNDNFVGSVELQGQLDSLMTDYLE